MSAAEAMFGRDATNQKSAEQMFSDFHQALAALSSNELAGKRDGFCGYTGCGSIEW